MTAISIGTIGIKGDFTRTKMPADLYGCVHRRSQGRIEDHIILSVHHEHHPLVTCIAI